MHAGYFNVLYICAPTQQQTITKKNYERNVFHKIFTTFVSTSFAMVRINNAIIESILKSAHVL